MKFVIKLGEYYLKPVGFEIDKSDTPSLSTDKTAAWQFTDCKQAKTIARLVGGKLHDIR